MEVQWESSEVSHREPPPPGHINKAAFKLFGRRKPAIFSMRGRVEVAKAAGKAPLIRSQTHDGLSELEGRGKEEPRAPPTTRHAVAKSLSFFSLLRRNGRGGGAEPRTPRQKMGLRGFLSSMRWPRRDKEPRRGHDQQQEVQEAVVLSLEPQPGADLPGAAMRESHGLEGMPRQPAHSSPILAVPEAPVMTVTPPDRTNDAENPPLEQSVDRLCCLFTDVTSLKSFDSLTGCGDIIADAEEEGAGSRSSSGTGSSGGGGALTEERASPAQEGTLALVPAPISPPVPVVLQQPSSPLKVQGDGLVAYMGGGEEMASPEQVDDADMQGLWHMLPQQGEDPARSASSPSATQPEKKPPPLKALGLSRIPVSSRVGGWHHRQAMPDEGRAKDPTAQDTLPNSDEGYWDSPTPGPDEDGEGDEEDSSSPLLRDSIPRDSCSGDALYDLYDLDVDPECSPGIVASDEEVSTISTHTSALAMPPQVGPTPTPASSFRSLKGSTSLPRDSRIPVSIKQVAPSHSASQGALLTAPPQAAQPKAEVLRTKIPVSKVPVRRISNKPASNRTHDIHGK